MNKKMSFVVILSALAVLTLPTVGASAEVVAPAAITLPTAQAAQGTQPAGGEILECPRQQYYRAEGGCWNCQDDSAAKAGSGICGPIRIIHVRLTQ